MSKISVIIPTYNPNIKIKECLDSLMNQTHRDLEIIIINDASTDETEKILETYKQKDSRIRIIQNSTNQGPGVARNKGLDIATGEYISFLDSDDYLDLDTYEKVNETIIEEKPDIIRFKQNSFLEFFGKRISLDFFTNNAFNHQTGIINPKQNLFYVAFESPGVCNKVFKRDLIENTRFIENKKWEDYPFCTFLLAKANKIIIIPGGNYHYRHSLTLASTTLKDIQTPSDKILEIYDCCDFLEEEYQKEDLFNHFQSALRSSQEVNSLQRVRDVMFSKNYTQKQKKEIISALVHLTELKYGSPFHNEMYQKFLKLRNFYNFRMQIVQKIYLETKEKEMKEEEIKEKIRRLMMTNP